MILSAQSIRDKCQPRYRTLPLPDGWRPMIEPFAERTLHEKSGTTYGLGPATYDVRLGERVRLQRSGDFKLAVTLERFVMPLDVCATVMDKSSLARRGLAVQNTHLDPGWEGWLTLELTNHGPDNLLLEMGEPIAQIKFELLDRATEQPYNGKYQMQEARPVAAIAEVSRR